MIIFFQQLIVLVFLWILKMIDGLMEIFSAISGICNVSYKGEKVNIIEFIAGDSTINSIFWCVFILAIGLSCLFTIIALIKNIISSNRNISSIVGKFFLSILGLLAMVAVVILLILISNSILVLVAEIFNIGNTTKISSSLFNACVGEWLNGYSINEFDINTVTVKDILGTYKTGFIFPEKWNYNGLVNPDKFLYLPAVIASFALIFSLMVAVLNLAKRIYEIAFLYIVMPVSMSTLALDDGVRFRSWRETFISKIILAYGTVFSVNVFILILPLISNMHVYGVGEFSNSLFLIFMIVGGAMVIPSGQALFTKLFGGENDYTTASGYIHSALHSGRMLTLMTLSSVKKMIHSGANLGKNMGHKNKTNNGHKYSDKDRKTK